MREAIEHYDGDRGRYPDSVQDLVDQRYLRSVPNDPISGLADARVPVPPGDAGSGGLQDIRSGTPGNGRDGTPYAS